MSFAADMKAFADTFNDTYKNFKRTSADELNLAKAEEIRFVLDRERRAKVARAGGASGDTYDATTVHGVDTSDTPTSGYNPSGKAPSFTSVRFNTDAPKLISDLQNEVGLPEHAAKGFVGRLGAETGGFSTLQETNPVVPGSRGGFGFAQWTGPRRIAFEKYVAANKLDPVSYDANAGFLIHELKNTAEGRVLKDLLRSRDEQHAGTITEKQFLRPGIPHGRRGVDWVERAKRLGPLPRRAALDLEPVAIDSATGKPIPANAARLDTSAIDRAHPQLGPRAALDLEEEPIVYAAKGGVIPRYDTTQMENAGSNPVTRDVLDEADDDDRSDLVDVEGARQAVAGGLRFGQRLLGLESHHAAIPDAAPLNQQGVRALTVNATAASPQDMETIYRTIDPKKKMPPELREIAAYNAERLFWMAEGQPQRAEAMAWAMLGASKRAASQYGAVALATEDPKKRAEVIAQAYNRLIPDGTTMEITGGGKNGAKFELHDAQGRVTEKGALAMDDMVEMATGMVNGTQWLQSMVKFATSAPTAAERKAESESKAAAAFDESLDPEQRDEYRRTLSEDQLKKFNAMSAGRQKERIVSWANDQKREFARTREEFRQQHANDSLALKEEEAELKRGERQDAVADRWSRFDIRRDDKAMRDARKDEIQAFDMARKQGNWETMRNDRLSINERWQALKERDLGDRNARNTENREARQKRYEEIDRRIIERRGTKDSPIKMGVKEAAESRRLGGLDAAETAGLEAIERAVPLTPGGSEGAMEEQRARRVETEQGPVRAQAGFMRIPEAKREPDVKDVKEMDDYIKSKMPEPEKATDRMWIRRIATDISSAGGAKMPNDEAAEFVLAAVDPKSPDPKVLPGGMVQLRPGLPPVQMTGESLTALAQLRARAQATVFKASNREQERRMARGPAVQLTPWNTPEDRAARAANRRRAIELMGTR